ncbi:MAG: glycine cleavage T C-terminal barrel domain-containing protein [Pseudomonadota bacterium]
MIFAADDPLRDTPKPTALFAAAASYCEANAWTSVNGWSVVRLFTSVEEEMRAVRSGAVIADLGAIVRYAVRGEDAAEMLARLTTAPAMRLKAGESARGLILTDQGAVIDLAEVSRLSDELFLLTTPHPHGRRMRLAARGFNVAYDDISAQVAALGIFGPAARETAAKTGVDLAGEGATASGHVRGVETAARSTQFGAVPGVELVFPREDALTVWERLMRVEGVCPIGLDTLEVLRIESGAPRTGADFISAEHKITPHVRTPAALGLPHLAPLERGWFNGRRGLRGAAKPTRRLVALTLDTEEAAPGGAVLADARPAGRITTCAYSPAAKRVIAFADVAAAALKYPLEVAAPPPAEERVRAALLETPESALARDFLAMQKKSTE